MSKKTGHGRAGTKRGSKKAEKNPIFKKMKNGRVVIREAVLHKVFEILDTEKIEAPGIGYDGPPDSVWKTDNGFTAHFTLYPDFSDEEAAALWIAAERNENNLIAILRQAAYDGVHKLAKKAVKGIHPVIPKHPHPFDL